MEKAELEEAERAVLLDEVKNQHYKREMFLEPYERTEHKGLLPAD